MKLSKDVERIVFNLMRRTEFWLDTLYILIPETEQYTALWQFIVQESGYNLKLKDIPKRFRTINILAQLIRWDYNHIKDIPKELWSPRLEKRVHIIVSQAIKEAETEKEKGELKEALDQIQIEPKKKQPKNKVTPLTEKQQKQALIEIRKNPDVKSGIIARKLGFRTQQVAWVKAFTHESLGGQEYVERILKV